MVVDPDARRSKFRKNAQKIFFIAHAWRELC